MRDLTPAPRIGDRRDLTPTPHQLRNRQADVELTPEPNAEGK